MKLLVVGLGLVGQELASQMRAAGHWVVGTTTTPAKVESLATLADEVVVLRGSDTEAVSRAAAGCDAVAVCAGPSASRAMTRQDREASYREILVDTAKSVVAADVDGPLVALSSLSVYGDAADSLDLVTEDAPTTTSDDPSPRNFLAMERVYRQEAPERSCVFRCADIYGNDDPPIAAKVRLAHQVLGGSVPFSADALFYRVHVRDVAAAIRFAIDNRLTGIYNLTHAEVPPSNQECFDAIGSNEGLGALTYRGELKGPARPVSVDRLSQAGFAVSHTYVE